MKSDWPSWVILIPRLLWWNPFWQRSSESLVNQKLSQGTSVALDWAYTPHTEARDPIWPAAICCYSPSLSNNGEKRIYFPLSPAAMEIKIKMNGKICIQCLCRGVRCLRGKVMSSDRRGDYLISSLITSSRVYRTCILLLFWGVIPVSERYAALKPLFCFSILSWLLD